jgi:hypothetical protein
VTAAARFAGRCVQAGGGEASAPDRATAVISSSGGCGDHERLQPTGDRRRHHTSYDLR